MFVSNIPTTFVNLNLQQNLINKRVQFCNVKRSPAQAEENLNDKFLKQNSQQTVALYLLAIAIFTKIGLDIFLRKSPKSRNEINNAVIRNFHSLKDNKEIPTLETCKSIDSNLKNFLIRQIMHLNAGEDIINSAGTPKASNRLLICGPAGVGKSFYTKIFAKTINAEYKEVLYSDFNSRWTGEHLENITFIFEDVLREANSHPNKKYVLVFNEIDTLLNSIHNLSNASNNATYGFFKIDERSLFLNYLEILREKAPNVVVIGTTNISPKGKKLDQAALSRIQNIIEVSYPDKNSIYEALKSNLKNIKNSENFIQTNETYLKELAEKMANRKCSFRNLEYIINEAKNIHLEEKIKDKNQGFHIEYLKKAEQNLKLSEGEIESGSH